MFLPMSMAIKNKFQEVVTFSVEVEMVKDKTLVILIDPNDLNVVNVKDLSIFKEKL